MLELETILVKISEILNKKYQRNKNFVWIIAFKETLELNSSS